MTTHQSSIASYNENTVRYNDHVSGQNASPYHVYYEKPAMRAVLPDITGKDILCVGCGNGAEADWFVQNGATKVVGIDISDELIKIAKRSYPEIHFRTMDMEALDFPDESFDLAYSSLTLHYVDDWTKTLSLTRTMLKPGGQ